MGLVIAMDRYSRQEVVDVLRHAGWPDLADEASRTLPDPVDATQLETWEMQHRFSFEDLKSRFGSRGGNP
jgi:hypothetical protein